MDSMTHRSKILKTKKRLSSDRTSFELIVIAFLGLAAIMMAMFRTVTAGRDYGIVQTTIPIIADAAETKKTVSLLSAATPTIVLTENSFFLASAGEFNRDFYNAKNKFKVPHIGGRPQVDDLVDLYKKWSFSKRKSENAFNDIILVPKGNIPMPVVIQVMAMIRERTGADNIVLGTGIM